MQPVCFVGWQKRSESRGCNTKRIQCTFGLANARLVMLCYCLFQTCTQCSPPMMLPNPCAVSAHQRIHKHRAPHVCPECGGTARQASFQTHLEEACLHFARRIGYRWAAMSRVFSVPSSPITPPSGLYIRWSVNSVFRQMRIGG